jgi:hypothetical protein
MFLSKRLSIGEFENIRRKLRNAEGRMEESLRELGEKAEEKLEEGLKNLREDLGRKLDAINGDLE